MSRAVLAVFWRRLRTGIGIGLMVNLVATIAQAGPCSEDIAKFEAAIRASANNPFAGLSAPQSTAAQLGREPTVESMKQAEKQLKLKFSTTLRRAKRLDATDDRAGCQRALSKAQQMYLF